MNRNTFLHQSHPKKRILGIWSEGGACGGRNGESGPYVGGFSSIGESYDLLVHNCSQDDLLEFGNTKSPWNCVHF
ncbi:unnamed protein product [Arabis nemorensis]|uniref:Uncharacterized protein n=1 Tax=Arabis nemorensis TaxID=586526 RepID=A0A565BRY5_9BRAS|nr:unnamed protein product [Arabis nemorensis]